MVGVARTAAVVAGVALIAVACAKVPYTNRKQFTIIPAKTMQALGAQTYDEMLAAAKVVKDGEDVETLRRVGKKVAKVANQEDFAWKFNLMKDAEINAWCLPGGYIGFYTGILPVLNNEAGMGFVMGHEVGHAVARHGAERMSQQLALTGGLSVLDMVISGSGKVSEQQRGVIMGALGLGAEFGVMLPFSRAHEKEADIIGMMYMAEAGYPPAESVKVWDRMAAVTGKGGPAFLSTHPSFDARKEAQQEWMGEAKKRFARAKGSDDTRKAIWTGAAD